MSDLPVNIVDIAVAVVLLISALLAFTRGLVREVLSIGSWLAAAAAALYGYKSVSPLVLELIAPPAPAAGTTAVPSGIFAYVSPETLADAGAAGGLFVLTLIVCSILSHYVSRLVRGIGALGALDRSLGLLFGVARGALLVCLAFLAFVWVLPRVEDRPAWVAEARSLPFIAEGAAWLSQAIPEDLLRRAGEAAGISPGAPAPPNPAASTDASGYKDSDREDIDRLMKSSQ